MWKQYKEQVDPETASKIEAFIVEKETVREWSGHTTIAMRGVLYNFFSKVKKKISDITQDDFIGWLDEYRINEKTKNPKKPRTINQRMALLKIFFLYAVDEFGLADIPIYDKWRVKEPETLPRHLSETDYTKLKAYAKTLSLRDRTMVLLFLDTGIRAAELVSLCVENISLKNRSIHVPSKGKKIRKIFFKEETLFVLKLLIDSLPNGQTRLFLNCKGEPITDRSVRRLFNKIGFKLNYVRRLTPHVCHHTFATRLLEKGATLTTVRILIDHKRSTTTQLYAKASFKRKLAEYDKHVE